MIFKIIITYTFTFGNRKMTEKEGDRRKKEYSKNVRKKRTITENINFNYITEIKN